ncbi:hypothetical protein FRAAL3725 [Frankia alni ACN14a]|uniref:Aminoglycoside phosphotransferase domain-containing protein n=1 Tax=Frankia alni (strain DSM 45986 / CECT 9034 / ACN14a) TaxID=326424 RepID=Q0RJE4_FRAAA|nr:phosphotransferase [Frankia sp. ACN10a]CAJ62368.1 hypothetical protein FRAAL3725 [Frankia alni ACN14a]
MWFGRQGGPRRCPARPGRHLEETERACSTQSCLAGPPGSRRGRGLRHPAPPFSPACGLELFEAAHRQLDALGIRTPRIRLTGRSGRHYPADIAVVEDVPGGTLEQRLRRDPRSVQATMARLGETLRAMARHRGASVGTTGGWGAATSTSGV